MLTPSSSSSNPHYHRYYYYNCWRQIAPQKIFSQCQQRHSSATQVQSKPSITALTNQFNPSITAAFQLTWLAACEPLLQWPHFFPSPTASCIFTCPVQLLSPLAGHSQWLETWDSHFSLAAIFTIFSAHKWSNQGCHCQVSPIPLPVPRDCCHIGCAFSSTAAPWSVQLS